MRSFMFCNQFGFGRLIGLSLALGSGSAATADQLLISEQLANSGDRVQRHAWPSLDLVNHAIPIGMSSLSTVGQMALGPEGHLFVSSTDANTVLRYDLRTGSRVGDGVFIQAGLAGLSDPTGLAFMNDGTLLVASAANDQILRFDSSGNPLGIFASSSSSAISNLNELLVLPDGSVLVANRLPDVILRFAADGTPWGTDGIFIDSSTGLDDPRQMALGPDGLLYVAVRRSNDGAVMRFDPADGSLIDTFVEQNAGGLGNASGLAFGPDGNLYVSTTAGGGKINRYDGEFGYFLGVATDADVISPENLLFIGDSTSECTADLNGDGEVGGADLGLLFVDWGPCR
jgi:sugar lactone lactonase YvrE